MSVILAGINGQHALFTDGTTDGLTVVVDSATGEAFAPQPYVAVDPSRWDDPDPARVTTQSYTAAEEALTAAGVPAECSKRTQRLKFSVPKAVRNAICASDAHPQGTAVLIQALASGTVDYRTICHLNDALTYHQAPLIITAAAAQSGSPTAGKTSFVPPQGAQRAGKRALELIKEGRAGSGFTDTGRARAAQLARGEALSRDTVKRMHAYFTRHQGDKKNGWSAKGHETPGYTAWQAWGGDAGAAWARKMVKSFEAEKALTLTAAPAEDDDIFTALGGTAAKKWTEGILSRARTSEVLATEEEEPTQELPETFADGTPFESENTQEEPTEDEFVHIFTPNADDETLCDICDGDETALAHSTVRADGTPVSMAVVAAAPPLVTADKFALVDANFDGPVEFFVELAYNADDIPTSVLNIYAHTFDENWFHWLPRSNTWSSISEPADIEPIDADGAYAAALTIAGSSGDSAPITEIDVLEWELAKDALPALPKAEKLDTSFFMFCVMFDSDEDDCCGDKALADLRISGLFLKDPNGVCYEWNPFEVEWMRVAANKCPKDCVPIDETLARDLAARMVAGVQKGTFTPNRGTFKGVPGWNHETDIGKGLNRPHGPLMRVPIRTPANEFEFDAAFSKAFWTAPTFHPPSMHNPPSTSTSFSTQNVLIAAGGYTSQERSKNASNQPRDAGGMWVNIGDVMTVTDGKSKGRNVQVISFDPDRNMFKVRTDDGNIYEIPPNFLHRLGPGAPPPPPPADATPQKFDPSKIRAKPRATSRTPKATLPKVMQPMDAEALKKVVADYQAFILEERRRRLQRFTALTPDTSDVKPLYLAEVDELDQQAVLELIALVPASEKSTQLRAFVRRNGTWELDETYLLKIKSANPPSLVVITEDVMKTVAGEVDSFYADQKQTQDAVTAALRAAASEVQLWTEDGVLLPALRAAGVPGVADTPSDVAAARRLRRYWLHGAGAAKIRWNTGGDWYRCVKHLTKYMGVRARGYCSNLHKSATGMYTGDKLHRQMYGNKQGLRADGSALLISLPTEVFATRGQADALEELPALAELELPDVDDLTNLSYRVAEHSLTVGERFLVDGGDGTYVLNVLDPTKTFGWSGDPAILVAKPDGRTALLREVQV